MCKFVFGSVLFCYSFCGFRDALTFKNVEEQHIDHVENFIKNDLPNIISMWKVDENMPPVDDIDFFGDIHAFNPSSFKFSIGDRMQIAEIATHVKKQSTEFGPQYFASKSLQKSKSSFKRAGRYFGQNVTQKIAINDDDSSQQLYVNIQKMFIKRNVCKNKIDQFTRDMVSVCINDGNPAVGYVQCILCKQTTTIHRAKSIERKSAKNVLDNFEF